MAAVKAKKDSTLLSRWLPLPVIILLTSLELCMGVSAIRAAISSGKCVTGWGLNVAVTGGLVGGAACTGVAINGLLGWGVGVVIGMLDGIGETGIRGPSVGTAGTFCGGNTSAGIGLV